MTHASSSTRGTAAALSPSLEDYLETIFRLSEDGGTCRVSQIAAAMGFARASVTKALHRLKQMGLVEQPPYGEVRVTEAGAAIARRQIRTHAAIKDFLTGVLRLDPALAEHDACLIEHAVSGETIDRLVEFIGHLEAQGVPGWRPRPRATRATRNAFTRTWKSKV